MTGKREEGAPGSGNIQFCSLPGCWLHMGAHISEDTLKYTLTSIFRAKSQ